MSPPARARTTATAVRSPGIVKSVAAGAEARPRRVSCAARARVTPGTVGRPRGAPGAAVGRARVAPRGAVAATSPRHSDRLDLGRHCADVRLKIIVMTDDRVMRLAVVVFSARVGCELLLGEGHLGYL